MYEVSNKDFADFLVAHLFSSLLVVITHCNFNTISENTGGTYCFCQNFVFTISKLSYTVAFCCILLKTLQTSS